MKNETTLLNYLLVVTTCGHLCISTDRFEICMKFICELLSRPNNGVSLVWEPIDSMLILDFRYALLCFNV